MANSKKQKKVRKTAREQAKSIACSIQKLLDFMNAHEDCFVPENDDDVVIYEDEMLAHIDSYRKLSRSLKGKIK